MLRLVKRWLELYLRTEKMPVHVDEDNQTMIMRDYGESVTALDDVVNKELVWFLALT